MSDNYQTVYITALLAEIDRLTRELAEARAERDALATDMQSVLPGYYYMDPPDGGDVPILEQLRRMGRDAARFRWLCVQELPDWMDVYHQHPYRLRERIDAALAQAKEGA